ncbi:hypothetical protein GGG16DRAFT_111405 [Schizophyllum commune]
MSSKYTLRTRKSTTAAVNRPCKPLPKVSPRAAQLKASTKTAPQHAPGMTPPRMIARSRSELWGSSDEEKEKENKPDDRKDTEEDEGPSPPSSPRVVPYPWTRPGRKPLPSWVYDLPEVPLVDCKLRPAIWVDEESDDETEGEEGEAPDATQA